MRDDIEAAARALLDAKADRAIDSEDRRLIFCTLCDGMGRVVASGADSKRAPFAHGAKCPWTALRAALRGKG